MVVCSASYKADLLLYSAILVYYGMQEMRSMTFSEGLTLQFNVLHPNHFTTRMSVISVSRENRTYTLRVKAGYLLQWILMYVPSWYPQTTLSAAASVWSRPQVNSEVACYPLFLYLILPPVSSLQPAVEDNTFTHAAVSGDRNWTNILSKAKIFVQITKRLLWIDIGSKCHT